MKGQQGKGKFKDALKKGWEKVKKSGIVSQGLEKLTEMASTAATDVAGGNPLAGDVVKAIGAKITEKAKQKGYGIALAGQRGYGAKLRKSKIIGSRRQVYNGTMQKTAGGLTKDDLMLNKRGRIVSKKKHSFGVSKGRKFLADAGYEPKKGTFKLFSKNKA
jgi:hypothetical protein